MYVSILLNCRLLGFHIQKNNNVTSWPWRAAAACQEDLLLRFIIFVELHIPIIMLLAGCENGFEGYYYVLPCVVRRGGAAARMGRQS